VWANKQRTHLGDEHVRELGGRGRRCRGRWRGHVRARARDRELGRRLQRLVRRLLGPARVRARLLLRAVRVARGEPAGRLVGRDGTHADGEAHARALALLARDVERAAEEADELVRDVQTEAGAAVVARDARAQLPEAHEQRADLVRRHADARVADGAAEGHAAVGRGRGRADAERDRLAGGRELDRVPREVHEHLAVAHRVPAHDERRGRALERRDDALLRDPRGEHREALGRDVRGVEHVREELDLARLEAREVEDLGVLSATCVVGISRAMPTLFVIVAWCEQHSRMLRM
jgi:hypothetical protein